MDPSNPKELWSGSNYNDKLYKYTTVGNSMDWVMINDAPGNISNVTAIGISPSNKNIMFKAHADATWNTTLTPTSKIFKSIDGGANWTDITSGNTFSSLCVYFAITHIVFDPLNEKRIFVSLDGWGDPYQTGAGQNRVIYSADGGSTWTDISNGLTGHCVNHMVYQNGTNDVLYAATDAGVWRYNKSLGTNGTWECFNQGLPPVRITKIEINYCRKKLFISTFGRGIYSCDLPTTPVFHITPNLVNGINGGTSVSNPTLTLPSYYNSIYATDICVDANVFLFQKGILSFNPNHAFIAAKKSHVVLTGTMTTYCPSLWKGIQVGGDVNSNQAYANGFAVNQGILEVLNGGTIKNAVTGITTCTYSSNNLPDPNSQGAVVSCANAFFINNKKDIELLPYSYTNKTQFNNCLFATNSLLLGNITPTAHVSMSSVINVNFRGCNFNYAAGTAYPLGSRAYGINSLDSRYTVDVYCSTSNCSSPVKSKFQNLNAGIEAKATNPINSATVKNCEFLNNATDGANFKNMNYVTFVNNVITVAYPSNNPTSGLYLNLCRYYSVQNNTITGVSGSTYSGYSQFGIVANYSDWYSQTAGGNHLINRNTINNVGIAIGAQYKNAINNVGLKMRCNDMGSQTQNGTDIAMLGTNPAVDYIQGAPAYNISQVSKLVGNIYNASCPGHQYGAKWYVDPTGSQLFHANNSDLFCLATPQPSCSNYQVLPYTYQFSRQSSQCPDNYPVPKSIADLNAGISNGRTSLSAAQSNLSATIDGGNTTYLLSKVNANLSEQEILNILTQSSPYLSDVVLSTYFSLLGTSGNAIVDIHNKNKPVTSQVWQAILDRQLPDPIMDTLSKHQNDQPVSARRILEMDRDDATFNLNMAYRDKISYFLNDSLNNSIDTVLATIPVADFSDEICQLLAARISMGDNSVTPDYIDNVHGGATHVDQFCQFQKLAITANQVPEKWGLLRTNASFKGAVSVVVNDETNLGRYLAEAVLEFEFDTAYYKPYLAPQTGSGSRVFNSSETSAEEETEVTLSENCSLQLYPNPAERRVTVLLKSKEGTVDTRYSLEVKNTLGEIIFSTFIVENKSESIALDVPNGLYLVKISRNNKVFKETKLIIMK